LDAPRRLAKLYLSYRDAQIARAIERMELMEMAYDDQEEG